MESEGGSDRPSTSSSGKESNGSKSKFSIERLRVLLMRKKNERTKKLALRRKQRERMQNLTRNLQTTEAELEMLNREITEIEKEEKLADDGEGLDLAVS